MERAAEGGGCLDAAAGPARLNMPWGDAWGVREIRKGPAKGTTDVKDSPQGARSTVEILETIERLALFPELGHEGRDAGTYERGVSGTPYIVVYEVRRKPSAVLVIAVVHGARDR